MKRILCLLLLCLPVSVQADEFDGREVELRGELQGVPGGYELSVPSGRYFLRLSKTANAWCCDYQGQQVVVNGVYHDGAFVDATRVGAEWYDKTAEAMVEECNKYRRQHGLHPLEPVQSLMQTARRHSWNMRHRQGMSHGGTSGWAGENIAAGQPDPVSVTRTWYNSSAHRANMLSARFRYIGVGCEGHYWTQQFK